MIEPIEAVKHFFVLLFWFVGERNWSVQSTSTIVKPRKEPNEYKTGDEVIAKFQGKVYRAYVVSLKEDKDQLSSQKVQLDNLLKDDNLSPEEVMTSMGIIVSTGTDTGPGDTCSAKADQRKRALPRNDQTEQVVKSKKRSTKDDAAAKKHQKEAAVAASKILAKKILENTQTAHTTVTPESKQTHLQPHTENSLYTLCHADTNLVTPITTGTNPQHTTSTCSTVSLAPVTIQNQQPQWTQNTNKQTYSVDNSLQYDWPDFSTGTSGSASAFLAETLTSTENIPTSDQSYQWQWQKIEAIQQQLSKLEGRVKLLEEKKRCLPEPAISPVSSSPVQEIGSGQAKENIPAAEAENSLTDEVELVPGYGIKLTVPQLDACLRKARSSGTALARLLLLVFFSEDCLAKCCAKGTKTRPALDWKTVTAIIKYVTERTGITEREVVQAINGKCTEIRFSKTPRPVKKKLPVGKHQS